MNAVIVGQRRRGIGVAADRPRHCFLLDEVRKLVAVHLVEADAQHVESFRMVLLVVGLDVDDFGHAGPAPRCPEVDEHDFAAVLFPLQGLAIQARALDLHRVADKFQPPHEPLHPFSRSGGLRIGGQQLGQALVGFGRQLVVARLLGDLAGGRCQLGIGRRKRSFRQIRLDLLQLFAKAIPIASHRLKFHGEQSGVERAGLLGVPLLLELRFQPGQLVRIVAEACRDLDRQVQLLVVGLAGQDVAGGRATLAALSASCGRCFISCSRKAACLSGPPAGTA